MHHIRQIIEKKPYTITVIFDEGEKRKIDFTSLLPDFPALRDVNIFLAATLDDYPTIKWEGLARIRELDGRISAAPLDFCPDTLYGMSEAI